MFRLGNAHKCLSENLEDTIKELQSLPKKKVDVVVLKQRWASDFKEKIECLTQAKEISGQDSQITKMISEHEKWHNTLENLKTMQTSLRNVPSGDHISALAEFSLPQLESSQLDLLLDKERVGKILPLLADAKKGIIQCVEISKKYNISPSLSDIRSLASSYKRLKKAIKFPSEKPEGAEALVVYSEAEKLSSVYLPLESLVENPNYIRGMSETPSVYKTKNFRQSQLDNLTKEVKKKAVVLEKCDISTENRDRLCI